VTARAPPKRCTVAVCSRSPHWYDAARWKTFSYDWPAERWWSL